MVVGPATVKLNPEVPAKATRRRHTAEYKRKIIDAVVALELSGGSVGALLRQEGLYWSQLTQWRRAVANGGEKGLAGAKRGRPTTSSKATKSEIKKQARRIASLERKLSQAEAIIEIQKKVAALLDEMETADDESVS